MENKQDKYYTHPRTIADLQRRALEIAQEIRERNKTLPLLLKNRNGDRTWYFAPWHCYISMQYYSQYGKTSKIPSNRFGRNFRPERKRGQTDDERNHWIRPGVRREKSIKYRTDRFEKRPDRKKITILTMKCPDCGTLLKIIREIDAIIHGIIEYAECPGCGYTEA